jgi:hypothetical protein
MAGLLDSQPVNGLLGPISPEIIRRVLSSNLVPSPEPFTMADTWPAQILRHARDITTGQTPYVPGLRREDVTDAPVSAQPNDPYIGAAADAAGLAMTGGLSAPAGAIGSGLTRPGIRAYHGSPHDFERFDLSRIGTGEGAQAYGHGLYFAENEGVARAYKNQLSGPASTIGAPPDLLMHADEILRTQGRDAALKQATADLQHARDLGFGWNDLHRYQEVIDRINGGHPLMPGRMYEVNINAQPEQFLDWDKPLAQQPPDVRQAMKSLGIDEEYNYPRLSRRLNEDPTDEMRPTTGADAYYRASIGGLGRYPDPSAPFREAGLPGIKYLDQGSRTAGDGSRNYVVFDDKLIDILRKYGLAGLLGGGTIAADQQSQQ